ncbi:Permease of the drug/metabolite transporter (DMT) superfamily [Anaerovirgula multivorans]|uniref:Permease of the drug/metabolite transporter (DMT) superfamily n=1 Tax=Anaerovirgula multivorans TaxID=312168 RepID=A0A239H455_9FIRM|nr:DMT family transporter [Anaerovirgula multivorans]SNS76226.1 Permease of the drug/metabolite transporter (DMT) superfamily [Anaerovirgula multivorans]
MEENHKINRVYFILIIGIISVSFSAIFVKNTTAPSNIIAMYRMVITFLLFLPVTLITRWKEIKEIKLKDFLLCALSGGFMALHFSTWITSLQYTTVASSTVLVGLQPIFTAAIGYFLYQERLNKVSIIGMLTAIAGSSIMGIFDFQLGSEHLYGDVLALLGGFFGALYIIMGRGIRKRVSTVTYGFFVYGVCALLLVGINVILKTPLIGYSQMDYALFLAMAVICTIGGHTIFNWSLRYIEANRVSTAMLGEPVGATFLAIILLKEIPTLPQAISGVLILTGLYIFMIASVKEDKTRLNSERIFTPSEL